MSDLSELSQPPTEEELAARRAKSAKPQERWDNGTPLAWAIGTILAGLAFWGFLAILNHPGTSAHATHKNDALPKDVSMFTPQRGVRCVLYKKHVGGVSGAAAIACYQVPR